jgi:hypothetical protein
MTVRQVVGRYKGHPLETSNCGGYWKLPALCGVCYAAAMSGFLASAELDYGSNLNPEIGALRRARDAHIVIMR